ncbi:hypothetical protein EI53_01907 [Fusobacterium naviforme]|nr:hypothetical protein F7P78_06720 [Fusobacterium naviforme]PSL09123.1 hypothetical protein EI53_01907 [Fusobacterium naviforme]STO27693.1 Uncharacterised protein [Fusobacterium naviforme]
MKVQIIVGAYGHKSKGSSFVTPIFRGETCEVDDAEGKYLIETGAAVLVSTEPAESEPEPTVPDVLEDSPIGNLSEDEEAKEGPSVVPDMEYLETLSFDELKNYAAKLGIDTKKLRSKLAIREAIIDAVGEEAVDGGEPPELDASEVIS